MSDTSRACVRYCSVQYHLRQGWIEKSVFFYLPETFNFDILFQTIVIRDTIGFNLNLNDILVVRSDFARDFGLARF